MYKLQQRRKTLFLLVGEDLRFHSYERPCLRSRTQRMNSCLMKRMKFSIPSELPEPYLNQHVRQTSRSGGLKTTAFPYKLLTTHLAMA